MADEKPNETAETSQDDKLAATVAAAVTAGLKTALPEAMRPIAEQITASGSIRREAPQVRQAPAQIAEVSDEAMAEAYASGDKAEIARLIKQQRAAERQRMDAEIARITAAGGAAFGSVSKMAADKLPYYTGKYKKLIDEKISQFQDQNPSVMITPEHYKAAHDIIVGENIAEIRQAEIEEAIRKTREPVEALVPNGARGTVEADEKEPESLKDVLAGDWAKEFRVKQRSVGGRSDEDELRKLDFRGGLKEFVQARKQMEVIDEETNGTYGLDRDWVDEKGRSGARADKNKGAWV